MKPLQSHATMTATLEFLLTKYKILYGRRRALILLAQTEDIVQEGMIGLYVPFGISARPR